MKKSISISIVLFLFALNSNLSAQNDTIELKHFAPLDTFRLERYALPDLNYNALDIFFDFNSESNQTSFNSFWTREIFYVSPVLGLSNYSFKNNTRKQIECRDFLNLGYYFSKVEDLEENEKLRTRGLIQHFQSIETSGIMIIKTGFLRLLPDPMSIWRYSKIGIHPFL